FPRHQKTSSPTPAPTESTATIGLPIDSRSLFSVCTTSSLRPSSESFLTVATTVPITRASCIVLLCRTLRAAVAVDMPPDDVDKDLQAFLSSRLRLCESSKTLLQQTNSFIGSHLRSSKTANDVHYADQRTR